MFELAATGGGFTRRISHYFKPACFKILFTVPLGKSFSGCGMVTRPFFSGCLYCRWLPRVATWYQPADSISLIISLLDIKHPHYHLIEVCIFTQNKSSVNIFGFRIRNSANTHKGLRRLLKRRQSCQVTSSRRRKKMRRHGLGKRCFQSRFLRFACRTFTAPFLRRKTLRLSDCRPA